MVTNMIWQRPLKSMEAFFGLSVHSSPLICIERNARACAGAVDAAKGWRLTVWVLSKALNGSKMWNDMVSWNRKAFSPPEEFHPFFSKLSWMRTMSTRREWNDSLLAAKPLETHSSCWLTWKIDDFGVNGPSPRGRKDGTGRIPLTFVRWQLNTWQTFFSTSDGARWQISCILKKQIGFEWGSGSLNEKGHRVDRIYFLFFKRDNLIHPALWRCSCVTKVSNHRVNERTN